MNTIAMKIGEGYDKPNFEAPIDIKYSKLLDRLLELKKIPVDWRKRLSTIHANAVVAEKQLAPSVRTRANSSGDLPLDYILVRSIRDILKETAEKTLFGGLAGEAGIWDKLVTAYERQNVWMGEAALQIQRSVDFELPFFKKSSTQSDQQLQALKRRHADLVKGAQTAATQYRQKCSSLGIAGHHMELEVRHLADTLPAHLLPLLKMCRSEDIGSAIEMYSRFALHAHSFADIDSHLTTLAEVRSNTVTFTSSDRDMPASSTKEPDSAADADTGNPVIDLDWSALQLDTPDVGDHAIVAIDPDEQGAGGINWGLSMDDLTSEGVQVGSNGPAVTSWDGTIEPVTGSETPQPETGIEDAPIVDIQWDIDILQADGADSVTTKGSSGDTGILVDKALEQGVPEEEPAAMRTAYDTAFRGRLSAGLHELKAFVNQRISETNSASHEVVSIALPDNLLQVSPEKLQDMASVLSQALDVLSAPHIRNLVMISSSGKYVERLVRDLKLQAGQEKKLLASAEEVLVRQHDVQRELMSIAPKQQVQVAHLQALVTAVVNSLGSQLKRNVKLSGDINTWIH